MNKILIQGDINMKLDTNNMNTADEKLVKVLHSKSSSLYRFISLYNTFMNKPKDYGTGELINMVEIHILTEIEENPGTSVTELARIWNKTKGAISQTVTKLEKKGYITREKREGNDKNILLFATQEGIELSKAHKLYDSKDLIDTLNYLMKRCTLDEIEGFYKVLNEYIKLLE